jgi:hypothetical protein
MFLQNLNYLPLLFLHLYASLSIACMHPIDIRFFILTLDHAEPDPEGVTEPVPAEVTNIELNHGKPQCIKPPLLDFCSTL